MAFHSLLIKKKIFIILGVVTIQPLPMITLGVCYSQEFPVFPRRFSIALPGNRRHDMSCIIRTCGIRQFPVHIPAFGVSTESFACEDALIRMRALCKQDDINTEMLTQVSYSFWSWR
jgi:hypothetical protein